MEASSDSVTRETQSTLKRKSEDVGWQYAEIINPSISLDRVKCLLCNKPMCGGIFRLKQHIAGIKGNVASCTKAKEEDVEKCKKAINEAHMKKMGKKQSNELLISQVKIGNDVDDMNMNEGEFSMQESSSTKTIGPMDRFTNQINPEESLNLKKKMRDQNIKEVICKEKLDKVKEYVCRFAYEAGIPFNVFELDSCKMMFEAIGQYGVGCRPPTRYELSEPFLRKEITRTKEALKPQEEEWKINGCSIMTDAWSDRKRRSIMNLCVNCKLGTAFISSKDFSEISHTGQVIHDYVEECIQEIGPENVVQVVTDNATNNMAAAKLLKRSRPHIFWTSCAAHSINLMLESIANLPKFKKSIDQAKTLTIFIYAHHKTLVMMRSYTKKRDIVRPGVTRFASSFLSLQSISEKREQLKAMFGSNEWEHCKFAKTGKGKTAYETVMSMGFWNGVSSCLQVFGPLVKVLRLVDGDKKPSMGFVYGEILKAKEEIKASLHNIAKNYQPIIDIIDAKMKDRLNSPLHLMAYLLNPFYHYRDPLLHLDEEVTIGVIDCVDVLFRGNLEMQMKIMQEELPLYKSKQSLFGIELAIISCTKDANFEKFDPVDWWANYGSNTPNLRRLAMRILSLTTSSSGCERNWSAFEGIHTKKRNRLLTERLNNLVYVNFNAKLMNKHKKLMEKKLEVLLARDDSSCAQDWIVDGVGPVDDDVVEGGQLRELDDDDFSSDEEEVEVDVEYESENEEITTDNQPNA